jgi:hypothetical protein
MAHAIPTNLYNFVHRKHDNNEEHFVYCPLGHKWTPAGKSALDRERERLEASRAREVALMDQLHAEQKAHRATTRKAIKTETRAKNGVCPHPDCHRSFVDVARHVRSKHPELVTP